MENCRITQQEILQNNVKSAADKIEGSPQENKNIFDKLPELIAAKLNSFIDAVAEGYYTKEEVMKIVSDSLIEAGAGDMTKGVYDMNNSGVVDDAERLGGNLPEYYAAASEFENHSADNGNPHGVTKEQVGLGEVTNVKQMPISGGTFTGEATAIGTNRTGFVIRNCGVVDKNANYVSTNRLRFMRKS